MYRSNLSQVDLPSLEEMVAGLEEGAKKLSLCRKKGTIVGIKGERHLGLK